MLLIDLISFIMFPSTRPGNILRISIILINNLPSITCGNPSIDFKLRKLVA